MSAPLIPLHLSPTLLLPGLSSGRECGRRGKRADQSCPRVPPTPGGFAKTDSVTGQRGAPTFLTRL